MEVGARPPGWVLLAQLELPPPGGRRPRRPSPAGHTEADGTLLGPAGRHAIPRTH